MKYSILLASLLSLSGCLMTRSEVAEVEERKNFQSQVSVINQQRADQENRLQEIENNIRHANGRVEALEHRFATEDEKKQQDATGSAQTQKQLVDEMRALQEQMAKFDKRLEELETRKAIAAAPTPTAVGVAGGAGVAVAKGGDKTPESPTWVEAEGQYAQKDWKKAILTYQKFRDESPKSKNFADATYKIGVCFQELGKKDEAKAFFEEVMEKFPKSNTARKATYRLKTLK